MVELRQCEKGIGMFATKNIVKGTILFTEKPAMLDKTFTTDNMFHKDYIVLSIKYLIDHYYEDFMDLVPKTYETNNQIIITNYNFDTFFPECPKNKRQLYLTKYLRNAFNFGKNKYCMLFLGCKLNHDCSPNTEFYKKNNVMVFETITNIKKGQEITDSYTSSDIYENMNDKQRKTKLFQQYGFICECKKCKSILKDTLKS